MGMETQARVCHQVRTDMVSLLKNNFLGLDLDRRSPVG